MQEEILLQMKGIDKKFPGVLALNGVDFTLRKGEIHALMGENGAGKSTLIKVLTGVYQKDGGEISLEGQNVSIKSPQDAQNKGISTVYQEITLCPNLTVAENMFIGRENGSWIKRKERETRADEILGGLGIPAGIDLCDAAQSGNDPGEDRSFFIRGGQQECPADDLDIRDGRRLRILRQGDRKRRGDS